MKSDGFISVLAAFLLGVFLILGVSISTVVQRQAENGMDYQQSVDLDWIAKGAAERTALLIEQDPRVALDISSDQDKIFITEQVEEPGGVVMVTGEAKLDKVNGWIRVQGWAEQDGRLIKRSGNRCGILEKEGDVYAWVGFLP